MPIETILFDVGGVLFKPLNDAAVRQRRETLALRLGYENANQMWNRFFTGAEWELTKTGRWTDAQMWSALLSPHGITDPLGQQQFRDQLFKDVGLGSEMHRLILDLHGRFKLSILSNASDHLDHILNEQMKIAGYFEVIVNSHFIGVAKPERLAYEITLERLGNEPGQVLFIDDQLRNIEAAGKLGIHGYVFNGVEALREELFRRSLL